MQNNKCFFPPPDNIPEDTTALDSILQDGLRARALYDYQAGNE